MGELERELRSVIGDQALHILLLERGGTRIWIPETPSGSQIAKLIGDLATWSLINYFGSGPMDLPCGAARGQRARRAKAMELLRRGISVKQVALAVGVAERTAWNYKAQLTGQLDGPRQLDLFDRD